MPSFSLLRRKYQKDVSNQYKYVFSLAEKSFANKVTELNGIKGDTRKKIIELSITL